MSRQVRMNNEISLSHVKSSSRDKPFQLSKKKKPRASHHKLPNTEKESLNNDSCSGQSTERSISTEESSVEVVGYYKAPSKLARNSNAVVPPDFPIEMHSHLATETAQVPVTPSRYASRPNSARIIHTARIPINPRTLSNRIDSPEDSVSPQGECELPEGDKSLSCTRPMSSRQEEHSPIRIMSSAGCSGIPDYCGEHQRSPLYEQLNKAKVQTYHEPLRLINHPHTSRESYHPRGSESCTLSSRFPREPPVFSHQGVTLDGHQPPHYLAKEVCVMASPETNLSKTMGTTTARNSIVLTHPDHHFTNNSFTPCAALVTQLPNLTYSVKADAPSYPNTSASRYGDSTDEAGISRVCEVDAVHQDSQLVSHPHYALPYGASSEQSTSTEHGIHLSLVPKDPDSNQPVFRESYHVILHSLEDVAPFYVDWVHYEFYVKFIHFPTRNHQEEPIITDAIGPFISDMSPNGLTVRCDMKNSLIEIPYLKNMELRIDILQRYKERSQSVGRSRLRSHVALETLNSEWVTILDNASIPVDATGYYRGTLNLSVIGHIDQSFPSKSLQMNHHQRNIPFYPLDSQPDIGISDHSSLSSNTYRGNKMNKGVLGDIFFSLVDYFFPSLSAEQYIEKIHGPSRQLSKQQQRRRRPRNINSSSFALFCMDLPDHLCN